MQELNNNELKCITGGAISGTLLNSIVKAFGMVIDLGRALGTALRRIGENKTCKL